MNHPFTTAYNLILLQQRKRVFDCIYTESKALWLYTFILLNVLSTPALAERLSFDWNSQATVELDQGWLTNPWSTALDNHPSFLQVERFVNLSLKVIGKVFELVQADSVLLKFANRRIFMYAITRVLPSVSHRAEDFLATNISK